IKTRNIQTLNLARNCGSFMQKLDDHQRFTMALARKDVPRLRQLIRQAIKHKTSIRKIVNKIEDCFDGVYKAKGFDTNDLDLALLAYRLGGQGLIYAFSQEIGIPSIRTLRCKKHFKRIMPSLGIPTKEDAIFNMRELFGPKVADPAAPKPFRSGMSVLWDEVSQEEVACYFPHADAVGGFCREHSHLVNTRLTTFENAVSLAEGLDSGVMHYGKEASVIAMASFDTDHRGAYPVLISPTCKSESPKDSGILIQNILDAWQETYANDLGPIWSFATDGDASRRVMAYQKFMRHTIKPSHKLFKYLGHLPGLNLCVGDTDITVDFDWKHIIKRFGRLLRTQEGMIVNDTVINPESLFRHLRRSPDLSDLDIEHMLNPADAQDVPKALKFIQAITAIRTYPTDKCTPADHQDIRILGAVGEMLSAFMDAFIHPDWSLTQQLTSLSKYVHIVFVLFCDGRGSFMPHQLYSDSQASVKTQYFNTAKQQLLN
ncbi:hypothetical protein POSPLADRAFT_1081675, partial [Postia placenta MAD-698-R-SB12]